MALAAFATNAALRNPTYNSGPKGARIWARTDEVEFRQENRPMRGFVPAGVYSCNYGFASLQRNFEQPENSHAGGLRRCAVHGGFCRVAWCACRYHEAVDGLARYVAEILTL